MADAAVIVPVHIPDDAVPEVRASDVSTELQVALNDFAVTLTTPILSDAFTVIS